MNCRELDNCLHEFIDHQLDARQRREAANHLASCRRCAVKVAAFEQADREMRAMEPAAPPPDFLEGVRQKIAREEARARAESAPRRSFWENLSESIWFPFWARVPLGAAAALLLLFVLLSAVRPRHEMVPAGFQLARSDVKQETSEAKKPAEKSLDGDVGRLEANDQTRSERSMATGPDDRLAKNSPAVPSPSKSATDGRDAIVKLKEVQPATVETKKGLQFALSTQNEEQSKSAVGGALSFGAVNGVTTAATQIAAVPAPGRTGGGGTRLADAKEARDKREQGAPNQVQLGANFLPTVVTSRSGEAALPALPPAPAAAPSHAIARRSAVEAQPLAKAVTPALTNLSRGMQSGWLDLATSIFYVEFGRTSTGAFVRGHLDEKNRFLVTSSEVEGQVVEMDPKIAAIKGRYGWFELSSREFAPARPGLKPSLPYIEGYQDKQGEFHPISRRIYQAGGPTPKPGARD